MALSRYWIAATALATGTVYAGAAEIEPGVTYSEYTVPLGSSTTKVYVVAVDRLHTEYTWKVGWNGRKRNFGSCQPGCTGCTGLQRTSAIAAQYDDPAGNHDVIAAVNGSYFGCPPDIVGWPVASAGEIVQRPNAQNDTLMIGPTRISVVESEIANGAGTLVFANGVTASIGQYNVPHEVNSITAYTPQWDSSTRSAGQGVEVILTGVSYPLRSEKEVSGIVSDIRFGIASLNNPIPAGGMVLNGFGMGPVTTINQNTRIGDRLRIRLRTASQNMNNADMAITGIGCILRNGLPQNGTNGQPNNWAVRPAGTPYSRDPMTVLASNNTHWFMVVCDGRGWGGSVGMTFQEMADFLTATLQATEAINLDGGGSSTMLVNSTIRNLPSDGTERSVANCVMLVKQTSPPSFPFTDAFAPGGRKPGWDNKFAYSAATAFSPPSPGGDGHVLKIAADVTSVNTLRRGKLTDTDYTVQADIYCEYRPADAADGYERYGIFARDSGTGALGLSTYGGGSCYALLFDSDTGSIRFGRYVNGALNEFPGSGGLQLGSSGWRRFRIDCAGPNLTFRLDGSIIGSAVDMALASGYFGAGYQEAFTTNALAHGARVDNFAAFVGPFQPGDMDGDDDVDQEDFGQFQACMTGVDVQQDTPECAGARLDGDGDVDSFDFQVFFGCATGPNVAGNPACAG